jgi:hypothetical protein
MDTSPRHSKIEHGGNGRDILIDPARQTHLWYLRFIEAVDCAVKEFAIIGLSSERSVATLRFMFQHKDGGRQVAVFEPQEFFP